MPPAFWTWLGTQGAMTQFVVKFAINVAIGAIVNKISESLTKDEKKSLNSLTVNSRGTTEHQRIIYGETLAGGVIWFLNTDGIWKEKLYQGVVVAGHEIEDITDMWINDIEIPFASIDWLGTGKVSSGDFRGITSNDVGEAEAPVAFFYKYLGAAGQEAPPEITNTFSYLQINSAFVGADQAYYISRFDYILEQAQVWSGGVPNAVRGIVKGKKVYDPRSDSTQSFGTGPHTLADSLSWEWSDNPALCWADYMIDSNLGFGEATSKLDYGWVASAANICDGIVYTPVGTDKRFRCNGTLTTGETYKENIKRILSSMNGNAAKQNGVWRVRAWGYETPTLQFTEDDLRGDFRVNLHPEEKARYNTVRGIFVDKDRLWLSNEFPAFTSSEYVSRDNDQELTKEISLHMTKDVYMAQRLAAGVLDQSDTEITAVFPSNYKTLPSQIGGTIMVSSNKLSWTDKVFRVERFNLKDAEGIDLLLREDNINNYIDVASNEYPTFSRGVYTINDPGVPPPSSMTVASRLEGFDIWVRPPAARLYDTIKIYGNAISNSRDQAVEIANISKNNYFYPVRSGSVHYFWAKAENVYGEMSDFYPDSDYTNVFANVNTATHVVNVESTQVIAIPNQSSGWALAAIIDGADVHAGGNNPIKVDVTLETVIGHSTAGPDDMIRFRWRVKRGETLFGFGKEKTFPVNSAGGMYTFKGIFPTQVNTLDTIQATFMATHPVASGTATYHEITQWSLTAKIIPDETAIEIPGPGGDVSRILGETIVVTDDVDLGEGVVNLDGHTNSDSDSVNTTVKFRFNMDGTVDAWQVDIEYFQIDAATDWVIPNIAATLNTFHIKAVETSYSGNPADRTGTMDTWLEMDADREWSLIAHFAGGTNTWEFVISISRDGGDTTEDSATYILQAEKTF